MKNTIKFFGIIALAMIGASLFAQTAWEDMSGKERYDSIWVSKGKMTALALKYDTEIKEWIKDYSADLKKTAYPFFWAYVLGSRSAPLPELTNINEVLNLSTIFQEAGALVKTANVLGSDPTTLYTNQMYGRNPAGTARVAEIYKLFK
jgi:hypothetical protein